MLLFFTVTCQVQLLYIKPCRTFLQFWSVVRELHQTVNPQNKSLTDWKRNEQLVTIQSVQSYNIQRQCFPFEPVCICVCSLVYLVSFISVCLYLTETCICVVAQAVKLWLNRHKAELQTEIYVCSSPQSAYVYVLCSIIYPVQHADSNNYHYMPWNLF